jgi:hypothetical protein
MEGAATYLIDVTAGGEAVIADNRAQKGAKVGELGHAQPHRGQGAAADDPEYRSATIAFAATFRTSRVRAQPQVVPAALEGNRLEGNVVPPVGPGSVDPQARCRNRRARSIGRRGARHPRPGASRGAGSLGGHRGQVAPAEAPVRRGLITEEEYTAREAQLLESL